MAIKVSTKYIILALIGAFCVLFFLGWGLGSSKQRKSAREVVDSLKFEITRTTVELSGKTAYISQIEQDLTTERKAKKELEITNRDLRTMNVKQANEIDRLNFRIDTLLSDVSHDGQVISVQQQMIDSLSHDTISVKKNAILLPFDFEKKDEWLDLSGHFDNKGQLGLKLSMAVSVDVITGLDRQKKPTCVLKTDNPYLKVINIASYSTDTPKPKRYGIGLQVGYGLNLSKEKVTVQPYIGVGISANLIRF